jgi:hypothetical protein
MKARRKVAARRVSRRPPLTLTQRIERLERQYLSPKATATGPRFAINGDTVTDRTTDLTWSRGNVGGKHLNWADAKKACEALSLCGHKDWRLPTIQELLTLVDYERKEPAIDPAFQCESNWYWTSTAAASSPSGCAWVVYFSGGTSSWGSRDYELCVRAVRRLRRQGHHSVRALARQLHEFPCGHGQEAGRHDA